MFWLYLVDCDENLTRLQSNYSVFMFSCSGITQRCKLYVCKLTIVPYELVDDYAYIFYELICICMVSPVIVLVISFLEIQAFVRKDGCFDIVLCVCVCFCVNVPVSVCV